MAVDPAAAVTRTGDAAMKTVLVTGATDGIGRETARSLLAKGWHVFVHGRSRAKAERCAGELAGARSVVQATPVWGDLARMAEVADLAEQVLELAPRLDVLIDNAGVYETRRRVTDDGFEMTMAVNHFATFLLTRRLLPAVLAAQGRVVVVSSMAHQSGQLDPTDLRFPRSYDGYSAYAASKLANLLFTRSLAARLEGTGATVNALHPGVIGTKLLRTGFGMGGAPVEQGARTSVYLATADEVAGVSGKYFVDSRPATPSREARDERLAEALWLETERQLAVFL
jgi:NAD(P)-dependent dehydrogenase (short-subunit alcohol dehydrogenase family)